MVRDAGNDDGFLIRWSRRKQAARTAPTAEAGPDPAPEPEVPALRAAPGPEASPATLDEMGQPGAEPQPEEPAEPFVEPPSLELIDKDFDLAHWLKQNVPESWKLAALRRTWETDPFIHGYLNPAREYALDWNTPGGAPGYGPLTESDDVKAMVARIFGDLPKPAPESAAESEADNPDAAGRAGDHRLSEGGEALPAPDAAVQHQAGADAPGLPLPEQPALQSVRMSGKEAPAEDTADAAPQHAWAQEDPAPPAPRQRRRSGGAIPV